MTAPQTTSVDQVLEASVWPSDERIPLIEQTVGGLLTERAEQHPDVMALVGTRHGSGEQQRWTYAELLHDARRVAGGLLRLARPGDHVAIWAPNVVEWPLVQYGAALAGVTLVTLNPALRRGELSYALRLSRAGVLLHADVSRDYDMASVAREVGGELSELRDLVSLSDTERLFDEPADLVERSAPDAPAMMQFTSGTTGDPKGVLLAHRSLVNNARLTLLTAQVPDGAVAVAPLPTFHTAGCVISTLGPLWCAGTMVLIEKFEPGAVLRAIGDEGAGVLMSVPTVLGAVLSAAQHADAPAPHLDTVLVGASTVPRTMIEQVQQMFGAWVHNLYGQTELSPVLTLTRRSDTAEDLVTAVGRPIPQTAAKIVDPATGKVAPLGVPGEVCARGHSQMIEYYGDPEATAATVDADGWLHTGDLGSMDSRGLITLTGRLKELIIRGGENIAPAEIEVCLAAHPAVAESAVVGLPDETWGEIVAAFVTTRQPASPELEDSLIAHCREHLAHFKVPVRWYFRDELPHTPSGKVQKFLLRAALTGEQS
ncbi:MAG: AMP-binding protein [Pseudonocardiaceae bacterium]|nr:AMP-binding protein [Pseudonocardiaceae bacterium]